ncbi:S8 family peptidase [Paenibacillus sp. CC-CFT747]|nr:S8 family peptidase [Paenibacillus sp. CC-CFT747]
MKKFAWSAIFLAFLGLLVIPLATRNKRPVPQPAPKPLSAVQEIKSKQQVIDRDVSMTDELCRNQCTLDFQQTVGRIAAEPDRSPLLSMKEMKAAHPHMQQLIWSSNHRELRKGITEGSLPPALTAKIQPYLDTAKKTASQGTIYRSEPIRHDQGVYFVLGVPSQDHKAALVGVIKEDLLSQVQAQQAKNLRTVPYPPDNNWKVETVQPHTLKDKVVRQPEDNQGTSHYYKNEIVVKFKTPPSDGQLKQIQGEIKSAPAKKLGYTYVFATDGMDAKQLMGYFQKWNVDYAEPHYLYLTNEADGDNLADTTAAPNDSLYSKYQWNLPLIDTERGWQIDKGNKDVIVAVVDTGVDVNHQDLQGRLLPGYNVFDPNTPPQDDVGHGTHVAGVISALVNNSRGVAGMTWYNPVMPVKVLDSSGAGNTYNVAQGIIWAADHGAKVINMSLGNYADANFLHDAVKYAYDKDVVLVAASGNDNTGQPGYPAAYPEVFAVAAVDANQRKASFSNYGDYIDVAAPGVNIASTYMHNQYAALSGTSMASPHVSALAGLIRSVNPALKNTQVMDILRNSSIDIGDKGKDPYFGYGQIDVVNALKMARQGTNAVVNTNIPAAAPRPAERNALQRLLDWLF